MSSHTSSMSSTSSYKSAVEESAISSQYSTQSAVPSQCSTQAVYTTAIDDDEIAILSESDTPKPKDSVNSLNGRLILQRSHMFYGRMISLPADNADSLTAAVFDQDVGGQTVPPTVMTKIKDKLRPLIDELMENCRKIRFVYGKNLASLTDLNTLLNCHTPSFQVYVWLRSYIKSWNSLVVLVGVENQPTFLQCVRKWIQSGRNDRIALQEFLIKVKLRSCRWLPRTKTLDDKIKLVVLAKVWKFLFEHVIACIISRTFYVTENSVHRNRLFYYNKSVWIKIEAFGLTNLKSSSQLIPLTRSDADQHIDFGRSLGYGKLRFLPKLTGLRPIVNLSVRNTRGRNKGFSVNQLISNILQVLLYEKRAQPHLTGAAVWDRSDVYEVWKSFRTRRQQADDTRQLYFVKVDLHKCFETILPDKLLKLLEDKVIRNEVYMIRRFVQLHLEQDSVKRTYHKEACALKDFQPDFKAFAQKRIRSRSLRGVIFVDQVIAASLSRQQIMERLRRHLLCNILIYRSHRFIQQTGIPQGSVLSTMLCNLYYADLERTHLSVAADDLLVRQVDDFLFVSPSKERAENFLYKMIQGFPDYNCMINSDKSVVSFPVKGVTVLPAGAFLPWLGLLIDTVSLGFTQDLSRLAELLPTDVGSVEYGNQPGKALRRKLISAVCVKRDLILFDPSVNPPWLVVLNVFKLFISVAVRLQALMAALKHLTLPFLAEVIFELPRILWSKVFHWLGKTWLPLQTLRWLCLEGFIHQLNKQRAVFYQLIKALRKAQRSIKPSKVRLNQVKEWIQAAKVDICPMK